eukprot:5761413-Prymnesium_polylepis.1
MGSAPLLISVVDSTFHDDQMAWAPRTARCARRVMAPGGSFTRRARIWPWRGWRGMRCGDCSSPTRLRAVSRIPT